MYQTHSSYVPNFTQHHMEHKTSLLYEQVKIGACKQCFSLDLMEINAEIARLIARVNRSISFQTVFMFEITIHYEYSLTTCI